jgi:phosphate transport system permease protein
VDTLTQRRKIKNSLFFVAIFLFSVCLFIPLILIFYYVIVNGVAAINWDFFTKTPVPVGETGGGILNAILGSFYIVFFAAVLAIPWGICVGVFLYDNSESQWAYWVRLFVEVLQAIPSIVLGIIAYIWIVMSAKTFLAISGSFALALMMMPMVVRATEETLKMIPETLKEASLALGVPYYQTLFKVMLPSGMSGILTGILLGLARIMGETAPLLFTAFGSPFLVHNVLKPMGSLPLVIFNYATSPYDDWQTIAWGASLILLIFILTLNILIKVVISKWNVKF